MAVMKEWGERRNEDNELLSSEHKQRRIPRDYYFLHFVILFPGTSKFNLDQYVFCGGEETSARHNPHKPRSLSLSLSLSLSFIDRLRK